jgi:hypothetical protein
MAKLGSKNKELHKISVSIIEQSLDTKSRFQTEHYTSKTQSKSESIEEIGLETLEEGCEIEFETKSICSDIVDQCSVKSTFEFSKDYKS